MSKSRKTKKTNQSNPKAKPVKFGLNLGKMIHSYIELNPLLTQHELADQIGIGRQGFYHRLNNPTYGTAYDLIEISLVLKKKLLIKYLCNTFALYL